jgi:hypothetical protein
MGREQSFIRIGRTERLLLSETAPHVSGTYGEAGVPVAEDGFNL